jgi:predicted dehydrogenase
MTYRVALIGAGNMGSWHANQWRKVPGVELVGVLDTRQDAASKVGEAYGDWNSLLTGAKPDIIDICTPTPAHREYVELAAAAGKAIFVEKPLARTLEDCDAIVNAVDRAGVPAMPGHVVRYFPEYSKAKEIIDTGGIGKPATVRTARMAAFPVINGRENWYADAAKSGGVVLDMILHDFDWLRWTFGPVKRVYAKGFYGTGLFEEQLDYALVTLRFESGVVGHVTGSWAHAGGFRTTLEAVGDNGLVEHDSARSVPLTASLRSSDSTRAGVAVPESPMYPLDDPYYKELSAFVDSLRTGTPVPINLYEARDAAQIALAALTSIETGAVVNL